MPRKGERAHTDDSTEPARLSPEAEAALNDLMSNPLMRDTLVPPELPAPAKKLLNELVLVECLSGLLANCLGEAEQEWARRGQPKPEDWPSHADARAEAQRAMTAAEVAAAAERGEPPRNFSIAWPPWVRILEDLKRTYREWCNRVHDARTAVDSVADLMDQGEPRPAERWTTKVRSDLHRFGGLFHPNRVGLDGEGLIREPPFVPKAFTDLRAQLRERHLELHCAAEAVIAAGANQSSDDDATTSTTTRDDDGHGPPESELDRLLVALECVERNASASSQVAWYLAKLLKLWREIVPDPEQWYVGDERGGAILDEKATPIAEAIAALEPLVSAEMSGIVSDPEAVAENAVHIAFWIRNGLWKPEEGRVDELVQQLAIAAGQATERGSEERRAQAPDVLSDIVVTYPTGTSDPSTASSSPAADAGEPEPPSNRKLRRCVIKAGEAMQAVIAKHDDLVPESGRAPSPRLYNKVMELHYPRGKHPPYPTFCRYVRDFYQDHDARTRSPGVRPPRTPSIDRARDRKRQ